MVVKYIPKSVNGLLELTKQSRVAFKLPRNQIEMISASNLNVSMAQRVVQDGWPSSLKQWRPRKGEWSCAGYMEGDLVSVAAYAWNGLDRGLGFSIKCPSIQGGVVYSVTLYMRDGEKGVW